jgi:predicted aldo/keto reductase-like oxidoreductase
MNRRTFVSSGILSAVAAGVSPLRGLAENAANNEDFPSDPKKTILNYDPGMKYRKMGLAGFYVSELSLGGLVMEESVHRYAIEHGVNFVHMAWGYLGGRSIRTLGSLMKTYRDKVYIAMKDDYPTLDEALKVLNTDHVDFLMFNRHSASSAADPRIAETFEKLKNQGKVRFAGLTSHGDMKEATSAGIHSGFYQVVMPVLNQPSFESMTEELRLAAQRRVGVMAMKSMKGVKIRDLEVAYVKKLMQNPAVTTITKGVGSIEMFEAYRQALGEPLATSEDRSLYRHAQLNRSSNCMMCDECKTACPSDVEISTVLRCKDYYHDQMGDVETALATYRALPPGKTISADCALCRKCEIVCPNGIPIVQRLAAARELFSRMA